MEHRFKSFEQKKPRIYKFNDAPSLDNKKLDIIRLHKQGVSNEYIAATIAISHTTVLKTVRKYRDNHLQHKDMRLLQAGGKTL